ncbi:MAG TPA: hypothetical protein VF556_15465 [Pyrinomonadaceae bacterium]
MQSRCTVYRREVAVRATNFRYIPASPAAGMLFAINPVRNRVVF